MDNWFKSKWFVRVISLGFALLLFMFVSIEEAELSENENSIFFPSTSKEMETIDEVPVQIHINNEKYVVSGVPEFVSVSLEGRTSVLTQLVRQKNFEVFVDLDGLGEGEHNVEIEYNNVPSDISVYIEPKTIDVTIEEKTTKEFNITVDLINTDAIPDGFELGTPVVEPTTVKLTSSKSVIDKVGIVKVFVDVAGLTEPINNREVPVNVYDGQGNELRAKIEPENVVVSIPVDNPSKKVTLDVPTTGDLPDGFSLKSIKSALDEIEVFAANSILDDIKSIKTEEIDLSKIGESGKVTAGIVLPEGAVSPGNKDVEVDIEIEQTKKTRTIDDVPIEIENNDEDQEVTFIKPPKEMITLKVTGNTKSVSGLKVEDFLATIDIKGLEEGKHTVPITIKSPDDIEVDTDIDEIDIEI